MTDKLSKEYLELVSRQFKILSDPLRLAVIQELKESEKCVSDLVEILNANQGNISKHLGYLSEAKMVKRRKDGLRVYYSLSSPIIVEICNIVCSKIEEDIKSQMSLLDESQY